jgi:alanyl-tRNA synthetase
MNSNDIRQKYLDFFAKQGHTTVPSSSLIPFNDPTLLFTNAGMVQFKDVFLGLEQRPYQRAVSSQRCLRAGGKHNDLENVGYTARHHTFFEMLGNFSFGDYFKRDAIHFAWQFLTQELKLAKEKLWITVFDEDEEAADIWIKEIGIDPNRLSRIGAKDNFWSMGDTGPCGPCSEIFYDHGEAIWGGPPGSKEEDGDRYIEIWNLVFMQYNRSANGALTPLPKPSVDTGMGLERITAVMQGVHNNYETDLFMPIIRKTAELAQINDFTNQSLRVIADHLRATAFLIIDGVRPLNEGRGYVLRRIMRRAIRHGNKLGLIDSFFHQLLPTLISIMGDAYPELVIQRDEMIRVIKLEEEQFAKTLEQGMKLLEQAILAIDPAQAEKIIAGETIFKLYDTYGFPVDLTADIARERGLMLDNTGFEREMNKQREMSKAASKFGGNVSLIIADTTEFKGYEHLHHPAQVIGLYQNGEAVTMIAAGDTAVVILDQTPFYAEAGGQTGDQGYLLFDQHQGRFKVDNTEKAGNAIAHFGHLESGRLSTGVEVDAQVDQENRQATALNHSATHLLHSALQQLLGKHVEQKGSLVSAQRLRFDFTQPTAIRWEQLQEIEQLVNAQIRKNTPILTELMTQEAATESGAMALFGEKYGDVVRVLSMGDFSKELCGGTHAGRTGDIGLFKIIEESSIASGIRRIEAVTGKTAIDVIQHNEQLLRESTQLIKANRQNLIEKLTAILLNQKQIEKQIEQMQAAQALQQAQHLLNFVDAKSHLLIQPLPSVDAKQLRQIAEALKPHFATGGFFLASTFDARINLVAFVSPALSTQLKANEWIQHAAEKIGGKGGGRADFAQASAASDRIETAIEAAKSFSCKMGSF